MTGCRKELGSQGWCRRLMLRLRYLHSMGIVGTRIYVRLRVVFLLESVSGEIRDSARSLLTVVVGTVWGLTRLISDVDIQRLVLAYVGLYVDLVS
uniref:Uncharacterized protein n=1 Tax=Oryza sativa subsp. japonica TaxID=39947 RepID=Q7EZU7_ORYSJ|nr:hypothetical protein [Oryza sativa Japonica Group]